MHDDPHHQMEFGVQPAIGSRSALKAVAAQLDVGGLLRPEEDPRPQGRTTTYVTNVDVWGDVHGQRVRAGQQITLEFFWLSEWFPLRPGLFHTILAYGARRFAEGRPGGLYNPGRELREPFTRHVDLQRARTLAASYSERPIYVFPPAGKAAMLDGGVGSVRLAAKDTPDGMLWFMGASSTAVSHEGLPVALTPDLYDTYIDAISTHGAMCCTIRGQARVLPPAFDDMREVGLPRLYVLAEHVKPVAARQPVVFLATGAVLVDSRGANGVSTPVQDHRHHASEPHEDLAAGIHAAYVSFAPGRPGDLERAVEWLANIYAADVLHGRVITDFDEQIPRFGDTAFSLARTVNGSVERRHINDILDRCSGVWPGVRQMFISHVEHLTTEAAFVTENRIITIESGAQIHAPVTIADSIDRSFNQIASSDMDSGLAELLRELTTRITELTQHVPMEIGEQLTRDVATLTAEAASAAPRKNWCAMALDEVRKITTALGEVAVPVLTTVEKLSQLLK